MQIVTRLVDGQICAYETASPSRGVLTPSAVFVPRPGDDVVEHAASADLGWVVYTTLNAAVCVTSSGDERWRAAFEPFSDDRYGNRPGCVLSLDDRRAWIYRPDAMAGRDLPDQWVVLDAESGAVVAQADLETSGHGGWQFRHPTDEYVLLDIGEGQDGSIIYLATVSNGHLAPVRYPWADRVLIDLSPDGKQFMTVDHGQADVAFHSYPSGEVTGTLQVEDFGQDPDEAVLEWSGGYLDLDTVVVALMGEDEDGEEWFRHYRVNVPTGRVEAELLSNARHADDLQLLGDGTWLTTDPSGRPVRWSA
ncbi:hypothetical protein ACFYY8_38150 [Streptosporangium sp. NPDC001559]|uniref:hypothetical protein n=1 Tax=Streptosporangium sp. NPDC001559 TaxID=3366187 RepID=UPI0036EC3757